MLFLLVLQFPCGNTETFKSKKNKLRHQQYYRIPLNNSFETLPIEECQGQPDPTDKDGSIILSFDHGTSKKKTEKAVT